MNRSRALAALAVLVLAQLAVPAWMIRRWEGTLQGGQLFKFRTAPFDPYDAFRGRYVALQVESNTVPSVPGTSYEHGAPVYAMISVNNEGLAGFSGISVAKPVDKPYIASRVQYEYDGKVILNLPIDRYYMNEEDAPKAERAVWAHQTRTNRNAFILVRVKDGRAVVEDLLIGEKPIRQFLQEEERQE